MKHVNLDTLDEPLRNQILAMALEPVGSVLEFEGRAVAWVVPANGQNGDVDEPWTDAKNQRRCDLIHREYSVGLSPAEAVELARLQDAALRHRDRVAPLPLEQARQLYEGLKDKMVGASQDDKGQG